MKESKWGVALFLATHPESTAVEERQKTNGDLEELHIHPLRAYWRTPYLSTYTSSLRGLRACAARYSEEAGGDSA